MSGSEPQFYYEERGALPYTGAFVTALYAEALFASRRRDAGFVGSLREGFAFWASHAEWGGMVPVQVTPVDAAAVPPDVLARLAQIVQGP